MPIEFKQTTDESSIIIWQITEEERFFIEQSGLISNKNHLKKRLEFLASRYCLQLLIPDLDIHAIKTDKEGKPFIANSKTDFSISHSYPFVAVAIHHHQKIGIDIQTLQEKIHRLQPKFLSDYEMSLCQDSRAAITFAWCCKEAMYKKYALGGLDFKINMPIIALNIDDNQAHAKIHFQFKDENYVQDFNGAWNENYAWAITSTYQ